MQVHLYREQWTFNSWEYLDVIIIGVWKKNCHCYLVRLFTSSFSGCSYASLLVRFSRIQKKHGQCCTILDNTLIIFAELDYLIIATGLVARLSYNTIVTSSVEWHPHIFIAPLRVLHNKLIYRCLSQVEYQWRPLPKNRGRSTRRWTEGTKQTSSAGIRKTWYIFISHEE